MFKNVHTPHIISIRVLLHLVKCYKQKIVLSQCREYFPKKVLKNEFQQQIFLFY